MASGPFQLFKRVHPIVPFKARITVLSRKPTPVSPPWMRLIFLVFSALLSVACAQIPQTAVPNTATPSGPSTASESSTPNGLDVSQWDTYRDPFVSFQLRYPLGWSALEGGID